jgi:L-serine dehydratase
VKTSIFEIFKIGIGPSSSQTVGPMLAAGEFVSVLGSGGMHLNVSRVQVDLYGSLALTGRGHDGPDSDPGAVRGASRVYPGRYD